MNNRINELTQEAINTVSTSNNMVIPYHITKFMCEAYLAGKKDQEKLLKKIWSK